MQTATITFPDRFRSIPTGTLIDVYARGPERVRGAMAGLAPAQLRARARPGKWAIIEIVAHLADSELMAAARSRFACAQPGTTAVGYDQDLWVGRFDYLSLDEDALAHTLALFSELRALTVRLFRRATDVEWTQTIVHPDFGPITLRNILELYADHVERHLSQILVLRAVLGAPLDLPLLLPERLY
jgi:hypothetical protein